MAAPSAQTLQRLADETCHQARRFCGSWPCCSRLCPDPRVTQCRHVPIFPVAVADGPLDQRPRSRSAILFLHGAKPSGTA